MFYFGARSRENLEDVHPDLILLAGRAISLSIVDFAITSGARTVEEQQELMDAGASWVSEPEHSRHVISEGEKYACAIDVAAYLNGEISWHWPLYHQIHEAFEKASAQTRIPFRWGGHWKRRPDGPHFELPRSSYP